MFNLSNFWGAVQYFATAKHRGGKIHHLACGVEEGNLFCPYLVSLAGAEKISIPFY